MKRFFGMMPRSEIEKEKYFKDKHGFEIIIQVGPHGWTIIWAGGSSNFKDEDNTTDKNFETVYNLVKLKIGELEEVSMGCRLCCNKKKQLQVVKQCIWMNNSIFAIN